MILSSRETNLASIEVFVNKIQDHSNNAYEGENYVMNVVVRKVQDNLQSPQIFNIPMISRNIEEFKAYMKHVNLYLNLDKFSNNNKEHYLNLMDFLSKYFPK